MVSIAEALVHIQITHKHIAHNPSYKRTLYTSRQFTLQTLIRIATTPAPQALHPYLLNPLVPRAPPDPSHDIGFVYNGKTLQPLTSRSIHVQTLPPPVASGWARLLATTTGGRQSGTDSGRVPAESGSPLCRLYGEGKLNRWRTFYWNIDASADLAITVLTVSRHTLKYLSSLVIGGISGELSFYQSLQEQQQHNDDRRRPDIRDPAMSRYTDIDDVSMSRRPDVDDVLMSLRLDIDDVPTSRTLILSEIILKNLMLFMRRIVRENFQQSRTRKRCKLTSGFIELFLGGLVVEFSV
ncbi:uncharacterized protein C8R40DRAFT_1067896 [Lentinula edodes]|uniref:uncharacterized protein n=1 Tax=Lentinula edodes TaxID=5353 RepID=UPI001E8E703D|nr:uncharacterized protein C8R40DRAFT_1067896 [Lentinula edodes]KAH7877746.1 hypothetical protein C8R40DRAFT_1067896 [Lentinula edodes]